MACILAAGCLAGPANLETFNPKPDHPNGGGTKAISTAVSGIQIAENYPALAAKMNDVAIIRSMTSKEGSHPRGTFLMHTGYIPSASVKYPSIGAVVAKELGDPKSDLPSFVRIGNGGQNGAGGGFLGVEYDPFNMNAPGQMPTNTRLTTDVDRYHRRLDLLGQLEHDFSESAQGEVKDHQKQYDPGRSHGVEPQHAGLRFVDAEADTMRDAYGKTQFEKQRLPARPAADRSGK